MLVIGHRGAAGHAPENTLVSVEKALALGVDMAEVSVPGVGFESIRQEQVTALREASIEVYARTVNDPRETARATRLVSRSARD